MDKLRIDKWLWAARFFKTRGLAAGAVTGGKVHLNGERVKPAKALIVGDRLTITAGRQVRDVVVRDLSDRRGPAKEAVLLYDETAESRERRETLAEQRRLERAAAPHHAGRPDKRGRRRLRRLTGKD